MEQSRINQSDTGNHPVTNEKEDLIVVDDLKVTFFTPAGEVKAVNGVSYTLKSGEVLGIVGESGSGKSVSVNALMQLIPHPGKIVGGHIYFKGRDIQTLSKKEIRSLRGKEISMIFQDPMTSLNPVFTIGSQLVEAIRLHSDMSKEEAEKHAIKMLASVGINNPEQRMKQYPFEFSGGMRQRVMIAMGLCNNPSVLIADEPTTALDVTIQAQILDLMKNLKKHINSSIIFITHDLGVVSDIADNVIVMYGGRIVERGNVDDIFYKPSHPYTIGLINCLPRLDDEGKRRLVPIEGTPVDMINLPKGCAFCERCNYATEKCYNEMPPEVEMGPGHYSACWLRVEEKSEVK